MFRKLVKNIYWSEDSPDKDDINKDYYLKSPEFLIEHKGSNTKWNIRYDLNG